MSGMWSKFRYVAVAATAAFALQSFADIAPELRCNPATKSVRSAVIAGASVDDPPAKPRPTEPPSCTRRDTTRAKRAFARMVAEIAKAGIR